MPNGITDWLVPDAVQETGDKFVYLVNAFILFIVASSILTVGVVLVFNRQIFGLATNVVGGKVASVAKVAKAVTK